jgi:hypothetical protein
MTQRTLGQGGGTMPEPGVRDPAITGKCVAGTPLLLAGLILGSMGDSVLRAPGEPALNVFLWISTVAVAAILLHRRAGIALDRGRVTWLLVGVLFAAGLAWRDAPPLKLLALGCASLAFALAAYRVGADWVRRTDVFRYVRAWTTGALHAWLAAPIALLEVIRSTPRSETNEVPGWRRRAWAIGRGLIIATPLLVVFGALFIAADAVFADLVLNVVRIDFDRIASHVLIFSLTAWLATGYLRGFMTGTELPALRSLSYDNPLAALAFRRPSLSITEIATVLAALDLLFLVFVVVQFRYLFGGDSLVQVTPDLTYAEYARRGFFELVAAVVLVVPVLLAADWLLERGQRRDEIVFRGLAAVQIGLVLAITASALYRLRLYLGSYGLTDARFFAMVLLLWIGVMLLWLAATVLRGRRESFAFGALVTGLATVALLFLLNPDAIVARTNLARIESTTSGGPAGQFDAAYAMSLSADAVPALIIALPSLPNDAQCPIARSMLRRWGPDRERSLRTWNWSASRATASVRDRVGLLQSIVGPGQLCAEPDQAADRR